MKRGLQQREKKILSASELLGIVRNNFQQISVKEKSGRGKPKKINLVDSLMSALAMFSLKSPSLLAFDQAVITHQRSWWLSGCEQSQGLPVMLIYYNYFI